MAKIALQNVSVEYPIYNLSTRSFKKDFIKLATGGSIGKNKQKQIIVKAINNVSFNLQNGDRVGLLGHNGAGKSTLIKLIAGIYEPTSGEIQIEGNISSLINLNLGIEQEYTGYENIFIRGIIAGLSKKQIKAQVKEIIEFTGLGDYIHMPTRTYSKGMMLRLAFAISTSINPEILLIDEVFGAGDASFREKAQQKLSNVLDSANIVIMANHTVKIIQDFCNKAMILEGGRCKFFGDTKEAIDIYENTKTQRKNNQKSVMVAEEI